MPRATSFLGPGRWPLLLAVAGLLGLPGAGLRAQVAAQGYADTVQLGGLKEPTAIGFAADGRVFVAEKRGMLQVFDSLESPVPRPFADLRTQVHNFWDRGLLGLALAPDFPATPFVYVLYAYDAPPWGTAPAWGLADQDDDGCPTPPGATDDGCVVQGRLSRLRVDGQGTWDGTEEVLIQDWCQQFPSHSVGALRFGPDGMLYVSGGEGGGFISADWGQFGGSPGSPVPRNPCGDPPGGIGAEMTRPTAEGGSLRAQQARTARPTMGAGGAVIRVDPSTGHAAPGNPLIGSPTPGADRLVAFGFRNPFRFAIRPGTNDLYVGDVGWNSWEEVNRVPDPLRLPLRNFGWPCYEGPGRSLAYRDLGLDLCTSLYEEPSSVSAPLLAYDHALGLGPGDPCDHGSSSISGLVFQQGNSFPPALDGALFLADYARRCIWALQAGPDGVPDPTRIVPLVSDAATPVDLAIGPDGDLYYVDIQGGTVHRVRWTQGNRAPVAVARATPASGSAPLSVHFDGVGSSDPDPGTVLAFAWDLDDDGTFDRSGEAIDTVFPLPGTYPVRLRVTDPQGLFNDAVVLVSVDVSPPGVTLLAPSAGLRWSVGDTVAFEATASDVQDGPLPPSAFTWALTLFHCERAAPTQCHEHFYGGFDGVAEGAFVAPDHEWPSYLVLGVTARNSLGATDSASVRLDPATALVRFASDPPGLLIGTAADQLATPYDWTVILGSQVQVTAPTPQWLEGKEWRFASWSDGGEGTHSVAVVRDPMTLTATYALAPVCGDGIVGAGEDCDIGVDPAGCCTGACRFEQVGVPCDDEDACTPTASCLAGICVGQGAVACTAPSMCLQAVGCSPDTGCRFAAVDCDDHNECTDDRCDPDAGCVRESRTAGTECAEGNGLCLGGTCVTPGAGGTCLKAVAIPGGTGGLDLAMALDTVAWGPGCGSLADGAAAEAFAAVAIPDGRAGAVAVEPSGGADVALVRVEDCTRLPACQSVADAAGAGTAERLPVAAGPARTVVVAVVVKSGSGVATILFLPDPDAVEEVDPPDVPDQAGDASADDAPVAEDPGGYEVPQTDDVPGVEDPGETSDGTATEVLEAAGDEDGLADEPPEYGEGVHDGQAGDGPVEDVAGETAVLETAGDSDVPETAVDHPVALDLDPAEAPSAEDAEGVPSDGEDERRDAEAGLRDNAKDASPDPGGPPRGTSSGGCQGGVASRFGIGGPGGGITLAILLLAALRLRRPGGRVSTDAEIGTPTGSLDARKPPHGRVLRARIGARFPEG